MIPLFRVWTSTHAAQAVEQVLNSGHIAQGPKVDEFEAAMHKVLGLAPDQEVLTVNSGTSALHLAYQLAGVMAGDFVAVSPITCSATISPIIHLGAKPLWVDVDSLTGLISAKDLEERIDWLLKTQGLGVLGAVVGIDWAGVPIDYKALRKVTNANIIQDAAHSMLAKDVDGVKIGTDRIDPHRFICWSLQAIKHLTTSDGGLILAPPDLTERARRLRWFGLDRKSKQDFRCEQNIIEAGYKWHMNDVSAAIGLANLVGLEERVNRHRRNAYYLYQNLQELEPKVRLAPFHWGASYWVYTILVDDRDSFVKWMTSQSIQVSQVHRRNDEHSAFSNVAGKQPPLPGLDYFSKHQISIPCGYWLSPSDLAKLVESVTNWTKQ